ncbi:MAG TPA: ABC transporter ATP-binding protein [Longimicrobiaceae bacterium]|nr:ABC transporter ATP-binding protein [Longimicrobiaceae bacterium]
MTDVSDGVHERKPAIAARDVFKTYVAGDGSPIEVLKGASLDVAPGEAIAIIGESGAGKSTLLQILGGLDLPTSGEMWIGGKELQSLSEEELALLRNHHIGFVFQFHHLLKEFSVHENVMLPQLIRGETPRVASDRARELLEDVGLARRLDHKPGRLSGGEQQRVAVARALVNRPLAILADEPSGNLDPGTSDRLHDLLFEVNERHGSAMILVTHNLHLAARADRVAELMDGRLVDVTREALREASDQWIG